MKKNKIYHIITIGCQMNKADSERLASFLDSQGFKETVDLLKAGVVILNTCGVRQSAEDRVYGLVHQIKKRNKDSQVVITGCLSRRKDVKRRLKGKADIFLPINEMFSLPKLLEGRELKLKLSLDDVRLMQGEKYLSIVPKYKNKFSAFVPIGNGCNNFCSYCVVPYARGREVYRPGKDIVKEVKKLIKDGYQEINLIAQNVNSYKDDKYTFAQLLEKIVNIPGNFWLRFSSSHPKDMSDELIKVLGSSDKICSHLHLAIQSGDNDMLKVMNRNYTVEHYKRLIKKIKKSKPGIAITTDVIVGFPGETKKQFNNTVKFFKEMDFDLAYISQYSPRPGTLSWEMEDNVSHDEKDRREKILTEILRQSALENSNKYLDQIVQVLIEGINKRGKYYAKTSSYKTVLITPKKKALKKMIGKFVKVKVLSVKDFGLETIIVE